MIKLKRIH